MPSTKKKKGKSTTSTTRAKASKATPRALALLEKDHRTVERLFQRYEATEGQRERAEVLREICDALTAHAQLEEEIFYPALRSTFPAADRDVLDEAHVEHASIKALVAELELAAPGEELVDAKVKVLSEYVKHHVQEEEDEMFPKARKARSLDLDRLGREMEAHKAALAGGPAAAGSPKPTRRVAAAAPRH